MDGQKMDTNLGILTKTLISKNSSILESTVDGSV
jgi:hypothetical protein